MQADLTSVQGLQALMDTVPLHRVLGFRVEALELGEAGAKLSVSGVTGGNAARQDNADQAHGGAIATLLDTTATFAASAALGRTVPTAMLSVDYLRPAGGGSMTAMATVRKLGRSLTLVDVELIASGKLAAVARCSLSSAA